MRTYRLAVSCTLLALLSFPRVARADRVFCDFDAVGTWTTNYLYRAMGVQFYIGDGQYGLSNGPLDLGLGPESAWAYDAEWASVTPPCVMVPGPGSNNDIFVMFFGADSTRTTTDHVEVQNDWNADPYDIYLDAFDQQGTLLGRSLVSGIAGFGEVNAAGIWYALIYSAPGSSGELGVDNFAFNGAPGLPATGACCLPWNDCSNLTRAWCDYYGGTYYGDGTTCPWDHCSAWASVPGSPDEPAVEKTTLGTLKVLYR